jgi:hypothetical protein
LEVVTKALAANSFGEFTEQPFVDPLLRAVERPHFGRPRVRRRIPGQDRARPIGRPALPDAPSVTLVLPVTTVTFFP